MSPLKPNLDGGGGGDTDKSRGKSHLITAKRVTTFGLHILFDSYEHCFRLKRLFFRMPIYMHTLVQDQYTTQFNCKSVIPHWGATTTTPTPCTNDNIYSVTNDNRTCWACDGMAHDSSTAPLGRALDTVNR